MKKTIAIMLAMVMLGSIALAFAGCQVADVPAAPAATETPAAGTEAAGEDTPVAKVGDEVVTLSEYRDLFDTYSYYYSMYGMDITSDPTQLASFQTNILNTLLQEAVIRYQVKQNNITEISKEQEDAAQANAQSTIDDIVAYYRQQAEGEAEADPTLDVEQYIAERIAEETEHYTGTAMELEAYKNWLLEQEREGARADALRKQLTADLTVSDEDVQSWYDETLASQTANFTAEPATYKSEQEAYESADPAADPAYPVLYAPEGYARIMDIMIVPKTSVSETYSEYDGKVEQQTALQGQYGDLAFKDALNGASMNSARMAEILKEYKALKAETDGMEAEVEKEAKATANEAYEKIKTSTFESQMLKYTENSAFLGNEGFMMRGMLIDAALGEQSGWSTEITDQFALLKPGEYSPVFKDADGYHIVYNVGAEPAGARALTDVKDAASAALLAEKQNTEWETMVQAWMQDDSVEIFEDVYRTVGAQA